MRFRSKIGFGRSVHPTPSGGSGKRVGRTPIRTCPHCGMYFDTRTTARGTGDGNVIVTKGSTVVADDMEVRSGCPGCGSKNLPKGKIRDDSKKTRASTRRYM